MNYEISIGTLNTTYSDLHTLQVLSLGGVIDDSTAVPFANIVVPTGTEFNLSGYLSGDAGLPQWFDVNNEGDEETAMVRFSVTAFITTPTIVAVPEPATLAAVTLLGAAMLSRRRRGHFCRD